MLLLNMSCVITRVDGPSRVFSLGVLPLLGDSICCCEAAMCHIVGIGGCSFRVVCKGVCCAPNTVRRKELGCRCLLCHVGLERRYIQTGGLQMCTPEAWGVPAAWLGP
jgi:hypothetical protein